MSDPFWYPFSMHDAGFVLSVPSELSVQIELLLNAETADAWWLYIDRGTNRKRKEA